MKIAYKVEWQGATRHSTEFDTLDDARGFIFDCNLVEKKFILSKVETTVLDRWDSTANLTVEE